MDVGTDRWRLENAAGEDAGMTSPVGTRTLGRDGLTVSSLGLGCMGMSQSYGPADRDESIATVPPLLRAARSSRIPSDGMVGNGAGGQPAC